MFKGVTDLFKKPDPKELVRKWQGTLRTEQRNIDRQIRGAARRALAAGRRRGECVRCVLPPTLALQSYAPRRTHYNTHHNTRLPHHAAAAPAPAFFPCRHPV